jgi:hypothetical protein
MPPYVGASQSRPMRKPQMFRTPLLAALVVTTFAVSTAAHAEMRSIQVPAFTAATFGSALKVRLAVGGSQSISVEADDASEIDAIRFEVRDGKLNVWRERDVWRLFRFSDSDVSVTVTVPSINVLEANAATDVKATGLAGDQVKIVVSSASTIEAKGVDVHSLTVSASSSGQLYIDGNCVTVHADLSSSALVAAGKFECVDAELTSSSSSSSMFFTTGHVIAEVSSGAEIKLAGHPLHVDDEVSSGGNIDVLE